MAKALMVDEGRFRPICEHNWRLKRALKLTIICSNIHMETNPKIELSPRLRRVNKAGYFYAPTKKSSMLKMTSQESSYKLKITSQNSKIDIWVEGQFNLLQPAGKQRVEANKETLEKLTENKPFVTVSPPKLSPPTDKELTPIEDLVGVYLTKGQVTERFIGVEHVSSTTTLSLKDSIDHLFSRFNLSISSLRGQALVAVASKHAEIETFFTLVNKVVNVVGGSTKRCDLLREKKRLEVVESLNLGEISSGKGLNQETTLKRPVDVVEMIATDDTSCGKRGEARILLGSMLTFDFVFRFHLMKKVLGISDELYNIDVPNMDDMFIPLGRSRRNTQEITNLHHFRVDFFYAIIDMQIQELNDRFSEVNSDLLLCVACLCPDNSFSAFNKDKLIQLCEYYPKDFKPIEILALEEQIQT
ncbi:uncharacterized protein LOC111385625 [Olea europaea var. sylvestris]|uniref:uncharacterized protein LOC111385625 n=1 Tax=Olea europaea var. sylvestris TaxID=158386 RepID=UPI000C1D68B7|nr:uncharacterized protein LOC111385625 [Olea europaea var. sylvestris]